MPSLACSSRAWKSALRASAWLCRTGAFHLPQPYFATTPPTLRDLRSSAVITCRSLSTHCALRTVLHYAYAPLHARKYLACDNTTSHTLLDVNGSGSKGTLRQNDRRWQRSCMLARLSGNVHGEGWISDLHPGEGLVEGKNCWAGLSACTRSYLILPLLLATTHLTLAPLLPPSHTALPPACATTLPTIFYL